MLPAHWVLSHWDLLCKKSTHSTRHSATEGFPGGSICTAGQMLPAVHPAIFILRYTPLPHIASVRWDLHANPSPMCSGFLCMEARARMGRVAKQHAKMWHSTAGSNDPQLQYCHLHLQVKQKAALRALHTFPNYWQDHCYYHRHLHQLLFLARGNHILANAEMNPASPRLDNIGSMQNPDAEIHWSLSQDWWRSSGLKNCKLRQHRKTL